MTRADPADGADAASFLAPISSARAFPVRMVKLGGSPADPAVIAHLRFSVAAGFNAVFVYSHETGRWTRAEAPRGPVLDRAFLALVRWCRKNNVRIAVSVNPISNTRHTFVFSEADDEARIRRYFALLRRRAGVHDFIVSFDDEPLLLENVQDIGRYGFWTAPAEIDLARRLDRSMRPGDRLWLCASAYTDRHLGNPPGRYGTALLESLPRLPGTVGIVWTGTDVSSPSLSGDILAATRARLGGRPLFLYDNYPENEGQAMDTLGVNLGPLRKRDPSIVREAEVYLACPMAELAASRLALLTIADYLRRPGMYDADASWRKAIATLTGPDEAAGRALEEQAAEWGGWIGEPRFQHPDTAGPEWAAASLESADAAPAWEETARVYPERMKALAGLADRAFRDQLLAVMARRLAVARAWPIAREYLAKQGQAGAADLAPLLGALRAERRAAGREPGALRALDHFLEASGVPDPDADLSGSGKRSASSEPHSLPTRRRALFLDSRSPAASLPGHRTVYHQ